MIEGLGREFRQTSEKGRKPRVVERGRPERSSRPWPTRQSVEVGNGSDKGDESYKIRGDGRSGELPGAIESNYTGRHNGERPSLRCLPGAYVHDPRGPRVLVRYVNHPGVPNLPEATSGRFRGGLGDPTGPRRKTRQTSPVTPGSGRRPGVRRSRPRSEGAVS